MSWTKRIGRAGAGIAGSGAKRAVGLLSLLALLVGADGLGAQQGFVAGRVIDANSLQPLAGAQVVVVGTNQGMLTNAQGRFRIQGVSGQTVTLQVVMIGYRTREEEARVGDPNVTIEMTESAVTLDAVVVTGTPGSTEKRQLGNAVSTIDAAEVVETAPINTVSSLIQGRAPGVVVQTGTGMIGAGPRIRIRGASSFSLNDQPLIYVDGVRVNNDVASGLSIQGFGSSVVSRLNDINPEEIESIEIIKGPAAATLYGTEASNGVIQIITKRGTPGDDPVVNVTIKQGANWFNDPAERIGTTYWRDPATGQVESLNIVEQEDARGTPIFKTGHSQAYTASVSGGSEAFRYFVSADYDDEEGIEPTNYRKSFSGRTNLTVQARDDLEINASLGLVDANTGLVYEAGAGGIWFSTFFNTPQLKDTPRRGFLFAPPEAVWVRQKPKQNVNRFTGSLQVTHDPFEWLSHRLNIGTDLTHEQDEETFERTTDPYIAQFLSPSAIAGSKFVRANEIQQQTFDYAATVKADPFESLTSNTSVGAQYYRRFVQRIAAEGNEFPAPGLSVVDALAQTFGGDIYFENVTVGVYAQQQFGWRDKVFITGAVRADDNSSFGEDFDLVYYPKISGSWVIGEEEFFADVPVVSALKLRAAYGASGQQPETFAALRTYTAVTAGNGSGAVTPELFGNSELAPERGKELEVGFEAGLLDDRLGVDFTYYHQKTTDAILLRPVAPSLGFGGDQYINLGALKNEGVELGLNALALRRDDATLDLQFNFSTNESEVLDLGGEEFIAIGSQRHHVGFPVAGWFRRNVLSAELGPDGRAINVMCDAGLPAEPGGSPVLTGGAAVPCAEAPRLYLGRSSPKYEGSFSATLTLFDRLRLFGMADFKYGHKYWDNNLRARCQVFLNCLETIEPQNYDPALVAQMQSSGNLVDFVINDAGFTKLREVSASYSFPENWAGRIGASRLSLTVAGRNLYTWTDWTGLDPESFFVGNLHARLEQDNAPQLRSFVTTVNLSF